MRSRLLKALVTGAAAIGVAVVPISPAAASSFADCPWGTVTGTAAYTPALTTFSNTTSWTINLSMSCTGTAPSAGTYNLVLQGLSTESCTAGTANGNITGTGPLGTVTGTTGYQRFGIHLYGFPPYATSTFTSGGKSFTLAIWLDVYGTTGGAGGPVSIGLCPLATGNVVGHAAVTEL